MTAIVGKVYEKGLPLYEVSWEGYEDTTLEPVENLSEATEAVNQYERGRATCPISSALHTGLWARSGVLRPYTGVDEILSVHSDPAPQ